ncbi:MAG TPA: hypothetical protein VEQ59_01750, partial [Polyangiaceae bacterium]|nr:hypothetical protein [Polyangiaceae bacterium]
MNVMGSEPSSATSRRNSTCAKLPRACAALVLSSGLLGLSCSNAAAPSAREPRQTPRADAPLVAAEPGAWFDASGNLTVVGAGKRLRLVLSAPISACAPAFAKEGEPADVVLAASLPFHVLGDACRDAHP